MNLKIYQNNNETNLKIYLGAGSLLDILPDRETALPTPVACYPLNDVMGIQNIHLRNTVSKNGGGGSVDAR